MTVAYILIAWAVAADGLPTLPITMAPKANASVCDIARAELLTKQPKMKAVCRPVVSV